MHHVARGSGVQQVWFDKHTFPPTQVAGHETVWPHRFVTVVPHLPAQRVAVSSGAQHVPSDMQTSVLFSQDVDPLGPQATVCPQLFVAEAQFLPAHVLVSGSAEHPQAPLALQTAPASQPPQFTG